MQKIVINKCFGGFGLSEKAYEKLIEWGVPVRGYVAQKRNTETGLYEKEPANDGEVIFDRDIDERQPGASDKLYAALRQTNGRYWEVWIRNDVKSRTHPLLIKVVEELGEQANGRHADLKVVEVPDDVEWTIEEYDGMEHVAQVHETWS
jgi:hypothetical protein